MKKSTAGFVPHLLAFLMIGTAFYLGLGLVSDLDWPPDHDQYREMASARSLQAEGYGHDPYYRGESIWYNPLTHVTLGLASRWTGLPLEIVVTRGGAFLNLLTPVFFYLLSVLLLGDAWLAISALAAFLFCMGNEFPSWAAATYSPWLYPGSFMQAFFYAAMAWLSLGRHRHSPLAWATITGLLWGLIFLGHTLPALLFAGILAYAFLRQARTQGLSLSAMLRIAFLPGLALMGSFLLVSWPFLQSLLCNYHLHIINDTPTRYVPDFLGLHNIPAMVLTCLKPSLLIAWVGLHALLKNETQETSRNLLTPWLVLTFAGLGYGYLCIVVARFGLRLPQPVPSFHFLLYLKAALSMLFALGLLRVAEFATNRVRARVPGLEPRHTALALLLVLLAWCWPAYLHRTDHVQARAEALGRAANVEGVAAYRWTRDHGKDDDVFLAADDMGLFYLAPAGAKLVAVNSYFSNPYVDWSERDQDRQRMYAGLAAGELAGIAPLLQKYGVTHVVEDASTLKVAESLRQHELTEVFNQGHTRIYALTGSDNRF